MNLTNFAIVFQIVVMFLMLWKIEVLQNKIKELEKENEKLDFLWHSERKKVRELEEQLNSMGD